MITIKSAREIELMREAGRIVAYAHRLIKEAIKAGISTLELDEIAYQAITSQGASPSFKGYRGYPSSICASINDVVIHGIPNKKSILKNGDIIAIDIGANYRGYHGDSAVTYPVGEVSKKRSDLLRVTKEALYEGLKMAKPNNRLSDISHAIEQCVIKYGYSVVKEFTGHGIGSSLHEEPSIPNFGPSGFGPILKSGMTLAIEPMVNIGLDKVRMLADEWTIVTLDKTDSAHFEHTIVITTDGYEILTIEGENING